MKKLSMEDAQNLAKVNDGECLSEKYVDNRTKILWQCRKKHQWWAVYSDIQQGGWCPTCSRKKRKTIEDAQNLAKANDGECLSKEYVNNRTKMLWECRKGHQWYTTYTRIQQGDWCFECRKKTIEDAQNLAKANNGKCLSKEYINIHTKMLWECEKGHQWEATYNNIQRGCWCPKCKINKTQKKLSEILSVLLEEEPITIRPQWLKNPETNYPLEIDIYFPEHKIAVEYNGRQHYHPTDFAGKGEEWAEEQLRSTQVRDKLKQKLIKQNLDKVEHFIIFTYRNKIVEGNIKDILIKKKILMDWNKK